MGRFLLFFSYIGTRFSGLQKQPDPGRIITIQSTIERALTHLSPANDIKTYVSSRTDKGVHAFRNSCHVDLIHPVPGQAFHPQVITNLVNSFMIRQDEDIRVHQTIPVPQDFHARHKALGRKYVYRLAHSADPTHHRQHPEYLDWHQRMGPPGWLTQLRACGASLRLSGGGSSLALGDLSTTLDGQKVKVFLDHLDMNRMIQAAERLTGIHDYTAFSKETRSKDPFQYQPHPLKMLTIGVRRGLPLGYRLQKGCTPHFEGLEFWDIHVQGRAFLYRMVRKLVAAMVLHATGRISLSDIDSVLDENPRRNYWFNDQMNMSEAGLFLRDVEYDFPELHESKLREIKRHAANSQLSAILQYRQSQLENIER